MARDQTKAKNQSALGNDPFENMESWDWPTLDEAPTPDHEQVQPESSTDLATQTDIDEANQPEPEGHAADEPAMESIDDQISKDVPEGEPSSQETAPSPFLDDIIAAIDAEIEKGFAAVPLTLQEPSRIKRSQHEQQYIIFTLAGTHYAAPIANISEVGSLTNYTFVPNVPPWLVGVTNLRGDILSVVDLAAFLELESPQAIKTEWGNPITTTEQEMLIVHLSQNRSQLTVGLLVDAVQHIRYFNLNRITAPTITITNSVKPYLRGIYADNGEILVVLDFDKLLLSPQMQQFEPV